MKDVKLLLAEKVYVINVLGNYFYLFYILQSTVVAIVLIKITLILWSIQSSGFSFQNA